MLTAFPFEVDISPDVALEIALAAEILLEQIAVLKATPRWQSEAEAELTGELQSLFRTVTEQVIEELILGGRVPGDDLSRRVLIRFIREMATPAGEAIEASAQSAAQHGRNQVIAELQRQGSSISFTDLPRSALDVIRDRAFEASEGTIERITGDVMANLTKSYEDGLGIQEAARNLREVFEGMEDYELRRVARTEIISAQNEGTFLTEQELGIEFHEWIATVDSRTRDAHVEIDGVIVKVGDLFPNGLRYPGDRNGPIEEWINCRCREAVFLMPEGKMAPPGVSSFRDSDLIDVVQEAA